MTVQIISWFDFNSGSEDIAARRPDGTIFTNEEAGWMLSEIINFVHYDQEEQGLPLASPLFIEW